ncbi:MAG: hypothetical protein ABJF09_12400 [Qipengyuania citrea]|uniref:hypothetical protein n=1 Tax=Alphaproteobacteria TaxID=28211 RepID=UPI001E3B063A|nr:hypothetical protein [Qipengyuania citrea]MCD1591237.1 hypothetical protein [Qipengyuania citrea]
MSKKKETQATAPVQPTEFEDLRKLTRSHTLAATQARREGMVPKRWGPWGDVRR